MARSTYIYTVSIPSGFVIAAFTVRHECETYLKSTSDKTRSILRVTRMPDGYPRSTNPDWKADDFMGGAK